jgi:hypothetical protein
MARIALLRTINKMPRKSSVSIIDEDVRESHHPTGTIGFIGIDGEGITNPNPETITVSCIACISDLSNKTRYRKAGNGPYCRKCYYSHNWVH